MLIKNPTPFLVGTKATSLRPPEPAMTVVVRGRFLLAPGEPLRLPEGPHPLEQGYLTGEVFAQGDDDRAGECLYPDDFADFKLRADLLLKGHCHTPGGKPLSECPVRFAVGGWSKLLRVVGPRVWIESLAGAVPSDPAPFTRLPLGWSHAFGGPGYPKNPVGKGLGTRELPNVEQPGEVLRGHRDRPEPAGFGPISSLWPERRAKLGREYGKSWREARAPWFAEDFDWSHFNAAPPDQQLEGYLQGDEELVFTNLHPAAPTFSARLPALRIRAFVNDVNRRFRELRLNLDTLFVDLDEGTVTLTWRGVTPVGEPELLDVTGLLIASEPLAEAARPIEGYREELEAFERDPIDLRSRVPEEHRAAWDAMQAGRAPEATPAPDNDVVDPITALLRRRLGGTAGPAEARLRSAIDSLLRVPMPPGVDIKAMIAKAVENASRAARVAPQSPGARPRAPIGAMLRQLLANVEAIKKQAAAQGVTVPGLEALEAFADDPRVRALDPSFRPPGEPEAPPPAIEPGAKLSGVDLSGRDLRGADLRGADLSDAILVRADLRGALLAGAKLGRAVLAEAELEGADFTNADLTQANMSGARAEAAVFRGATLTQTQLRKATLRRAALAGSAGEMILLDGADLGGADAREVDWLRAMADGALLEGANFSGARLAECRFADARAKDARFEGAMIGKATFNGADLSGATFVEARGEGAAFLRATLAGADFRWATLPWAHLQEAKAEGAHFHAADLRGGRFHRASLARADFSKANLFGADFGRARMAEASFAGANLYDAKFLDAAGAGVDFKGANLKRSTLEQA